MLCALSIRNVVLIEALDVAFKPGLCVLTGETGAGKSILLDALGLALGARAEAGLVRPAPAGERRAKARVAAAFELPAGHPALALVEARGLSVPDAGEPLILRRSLGPDGRSRAYIQDQPVPVRALRDVGARLVEVIGQFARLDLFDADAQRVALDGFARLRDCAAATADAWRAWREDKAALRRARDSADAAESDGVRLRDALAEIDALAPESGEVAALEAQRRRLRHAERLGEEVGAAVAALGDGDGAQAGLDAAYRALARSAELSEGAMDPILAALDRASAETEEARGALDRLAQDLDGDPARLDSVEQRLFALRALARKHDAAPDALPALRAQLASRLAVAEDRAGELARLAAAAEDAKARYLDRARALSRARRKAAGDLDAAVAQELRPLHLGTARFATLLEELPEARWGRDGIDRIAFTAATLSDAPMAPLSQVLSGGELARFLLALKVVLARGDDVPTLVFDEVDAGIGGAVSAAVGQRLRRLAQTVQVLVVTHSPQVAAVGTAHWCVRRRPSGGSGRRPSAPATEVDELDPAGRREEIARLLAGASITQEARAAADSLIEASPR